jgi:membrane protease YdiL (CAAX protease family)
VVQRNLVRWTGSRTAGVWLAAAIFSAIHVEFFGFVPRLLLGLVLGYLYEWSGNILLPMAAHFTQNALQLVLLYVAQHRAMVPAVLDPDANVALPWPLVAFSVVLGVGGLYGLWRQTWVE